MNTVSFKRISLLFVVLLTLGFSTSTTRVSPSKASVEFFMREYQKDFHPTLDFSELIFVSINYQKLYYLKEGQLQARFDISTSKYGIGNKANSQKTPIGLHKVKFKLGGGAPINGIIKAGVYSGEKATIIKEAKAGTQDLITTRVMWLEGMEKGVNQGEGIDSYHRNIYIHGTPEEGLIGRPASHGCVRMRNKEVADLYKKINKGCYVLILEI